MTKKKRTNYHELKEILKEEILKAIEEFEMKTALTVKGIELYHNGRRYETEVGEWRDSIKNIEMRIELDDHPV